MHFVPQVAFLLLTSSFPVPRYLGSTSDPLYHPLSDLSPLEPSHVSVKMTFELVLVLFPKARYGPSVSFHFY